MASVQEHPILAATTRILRSLLRPLLRNGIPFGVFTELAKHVYVELATSEFGIPGRKQSVSRVSIITGLTRKEVRRVQALPDTGDAETTMRYNRAARVISGWIRDPVFRDPFGQPAELAWEGRSASFSELVKRFSGDVPARAVLDELLRVGAVEFLPKERLRLLTHAYLPRTEESGKLGILGTDVSDLIRTIDHNLLSEGNEPFFQRKVAYDNLPREVLREFRDQSGADAQRFLEQIDRWLSKHDRDTNSSISGTGRKRAGFGIYYFEEDFSNEGDSPRV
jgi:hypothetical protein